MSLLPVPVHPLQTTCSSSSGQCRKGPSERGTLVDMCDVTTKYITTAMLVTDFFFFKLRGGCNPRNPPPSGSATGPSAVQFFVILLGLLRRCRKSYCFSLPSTLTTICSLFFSFHLPGLCGSGAYVFSSGNHNSRKELEEVAWAWITEVYRGRANRGSHLTGLLRN